MAGDEGVTVLVTGAASGIGAAVCRRIAGPGVRLLAHSRGNREQDSSNPSNHVG